MAEFKLLINGQLVAGDATMDVINPATEETVATCARASIAQLDQAVAAAKAAFPAWSKTSIDTRRAALIAMADELAADDCVTDATWAVLAARWGAAELVELLVVAGFYRLVSGFLNSAGVQLDPGVPGFPAA
jgi:acyl-CoA reductase-like NAD-dependent aldehyde dehydrogenase